MSSDGKSLLAYDKVQKRELKPPTAYFLAAIQEIRANKERYTLASRAQGKGVATTA